MGDVVAELGPTPLLPAQVTRPRTVTVVGWISFGVACWMTLAVTGYLVACGVSGARIETPAIPRAFFSWVAAAEIVLGPSMMVAALRFLSLRRWTRLPLLVFSALLLLGTLAFAGFWIFKVAGFFREMRGEFKDGFEPVVAVVFQVIMTLGGAAVLLGFCFGFGLLFRHLRSPIVRNSVTRDGF